jgi:hypothetical protein
VRADLLDQASVDWNGTAWTLQSPGLDYNAAVGTTRARFELRLWNRRAGDVRAGTGVERCEMAHPRQPLGVDIWTAFSVRFTGTIDASPTKYAIFCQFHQAPETGESGKVPVLAFRLRAGNLLISTTGDASETTTVEPPTTDRYTAPWQEGGQWQHFVIRSKFHHETGELDVWRNGTQIIAETGIVMGFNDTANGSTPTPKVGLYRSSTEHRQIVEMANVEIGTTSLLDRVTNPLPITTA